MSTVEAPLKRAQPEAAEVNNENVAPAENVVSTTPANPPSKKVKFSWPDALTDKVETDKTDDKTAGEEDSKVGSFSWPSSEVQAKSSPPSLTVQEAISCMTEILERVQDEAVQQRIKDCQEEADGDLGMIMEGIVPIFFEIQGHVMEPYGFEPTDEGFEAFSKALQSHETDEEFAKKSIKFKTITKEATAVKPKGPAKRVAGPM